MQTCNDAHLKQRAIFMYRLMQTDLAKAQEFALSGTGAFEEFFEDKNDEVRERLFQEFNSLSVVYQKPSERFLKETELKHSLASEKKYYPERKRKGKRTQGAAGEDADATNETERTDSTAADTTVNQSQGVEDLIGMGPPVSSPAPAQPSITDDLLGLGAPI